ncbi:hypothetical protein [Alicyclobacillus dauci]|uniref:Uncharacterized protein n=1 Tax=Alicyclobacillus dauci TaxID=1475485 RepID=A0ABY6Z833_9BACL|nr:hypothetical protein [Alicyclobacillus dauci]WAH38752.1 hypothetical protein NZD86_09860 [Alicyclobacillus dauci]
MAKWTNGSLVSSIHTYSRNDPSGPFGELVLHVLGNMPRSSWYDLYKLGMLDDRAVSIERKAESMTDITN